MCYIFLSWAKQSTKPGVDYGEFKAFFPFLVEMYGHLGYILPRMNARPWVSKSILGNNSNLNEVNVVSQDRNYYDKVSLIFCFWVYMSVFFSV